MVLKCEVAHETKRALRESDHRRDGPFIELFSRIKQSTVASQSYYVVNLISIHVRKYCINILLQIILLKILRQNRAQVLWHYDFQFDLHFYLTALNVAEQSQEILKDIVVKGLDKDEELWTIWNVFKLCRAHFIEICPMTLTFVMP